MSARIVMRKTKDGVLPNKRGVLMLIDKIRIEDLSYERFLSDYADKKPFILLGAMENWECRQWTLDFIKEKYGDRIVTIRKSDIEGVKTFKQVRLANYIEHIHDNEDRWYCDWNFTALNQKDLDLVYSSPDYFTKDTLRVDDETGQDFKWFFLGSEQTGTPLHQDFNKTHAWNAVIFGQKDWVFFHPDDTPYLYEGNINVFDQEDMEQKTLVKQATPIYFSQKPGEIIYAPRNWWHQVVNAEHTLAVSENFWFKQEQLIQQG